MGSHIRTVTVTKDWACRPCGKIVKKGAWAYAFMGARVCRSCLRLKGPDLFRAQGLYMGQYRIPEDLPLPPGMTTDNFFGLALNIKGRIIRFEPTGYHLGDIRFFRELPQESQPDSTHPGDSFAAFVQTFIKNPGPSTPDEDPVA